MLLSLVTAVQTTADGGPDPSSVLINPHHALAVGAAVVACLLLLQYAHRRKPFILVWAAGWLLIAPAMLLVAGSYGNPMVGRLAVGLSQLLGVYTAALFLWSADLFRQTGFVGPNRVKLLIVVAAGFLVSTIIFGRATVLVAGYLIAAIGLAGAGTMYAAILIERRMIGAGMVAFVFMGLAISNVSAAFFVRRAEPARLSLRIASGQRGPLHLWGVRDAPSRVRGHDLRAEDDQPPAGDRAGGVAAGLDHRPSDRMP